MFVPALATATSLALVPGYCTLLWPARPLPRRVATSATRMAGQGGTVSGSIPPPSDLILVQLYKSCTSSPYRNHGGCFSAPAVAGQPGTVLAWPGRVNQIAANPDGIQPGVAGSLDSPPCGQAVLRCLSLKKHRISLLSPKCYGGLQPLEEDP